MTAGWLCTTGRGLFVERRSNSTTFVRAIPTKAKPDMRLDLNSPLPDLESFKIQKLCRSLNWSKPVSGDLLPS
jgi:hypothetical protein